MAREIMSNCRSNEIYRTADNSEGGKTVGVDPTTITAAEARKIVEKINKKGGKDLVAVKQNLVDEVWSAEKPARPSEEVKVLPNDFAGKSYQDKIHDLRREIEKRKSSGMVVSMLDEIAWLFNLRGNDIPYNPVFFSYATVTPSSTTLYVDETKLTSQAKAHLAGVNIRPYNAIFSTIISQLVRTASHG